MFMKGKQCLSVCGEEKTTCMRSSGCACACACTGYEWCVHKTKRMGEAGNTSDV